jgi:hypothetical protein
MQRWIDPFLCVAWKTILHIDGSVTGVWNVTLREIDRLAVVSVLLLGAIPEAFLLCKRNLL